MDFKRINSKRIYRLYEKNRITEEGLKNAVKKNFISQQQYEEIKNNVPDTDKERDLQQKADTERAGRISFYVDYVKSGGSLKEVPEDVRRDVEAFT